MSISTNSNGIPPCILAIAPAAKRVQQDCSTVRVTGHHTAFIGHFAQQLVRKQRSSRRAPLNATQHVAFRQQMGNVRFLKPARADNTKFNIAGILRKWKAYVNSIPCPAPSVRIADYPERSYCDCVEKGEWRSALEVATAATAVDFLVRSRLGVQVGKRSGLQGPYWRFWSPTSPATYVPSPVSVIGSTLTYDGVYLLLAYTGRPAELVDAEKKPSDGSWDELYGADVILPLFNPDLDDAPPDEHSKVLEEFTVARDDWPRSF
ncbi:MAG: hypothetical protein Q9214_006390 [Letrouitia sp. 1 TL-2023]